MERNSNDNYSSFLFFFFFLQFISNEKFDSLRNEHEKQNSHNLYSEIQCDSFVSL